MSITWLLLVLVIVGVALHLIDMDPKIKQVIITVIVLLVVLALLGLVGIIPPTAGLHFK